MNRLLMSKNGPAVAGLIIGVLAALLVKFGNPGNMGVCVACFTRDVAGALGLHRAAVVQALFAEPDVVAHAEIAQVLLDARQDLVHRLFEADVDGLRFRQVENVWIFSVHARGDVLDVIAPVEVL